MIGRRELTRALQSRSVADWVVIERVQDIAIVDEARNLRRRDKRTRFTVVLHHDILSGRGSARLTVTAADGNAESLVDQALALAVSAAGPTWKTVPPAAPAKVEVLDPKLPKDVADAAATFVRTLRRPQGSTVLASVSVMREHIFVQAKNGFHDDWAASEFRAAALIGVGERSLELVRESRVADDLALDTALDGAATDLRDLATAGAPVAGRCNLALTANAFLHNDNLGAWHVFAVQADSVVERQGLTRYRLGTPIAEGADEIAEPLTITSNGALDWALRSAPVGDDGDAIRRFPIIERGISVGLGLSMREAALRKRDPNGGVRNLVVAPGTWDGKPVGDRTVEVRRVRALSIDSFTGDASLELGLAVDHAKGKSTFFSGGTVRLDLVTALARARRSASTVRRGAYIGPAAVLIDAVDLIV